MSNQGKAPKALLPPIVTHHRTYETASDKQANQFQALPSGDPRRTRSGSIHTFDPNTGVTTRTHYHQNKFSTGYMESFSHKK